MSRTLQAVREAAVDGRLQNVVYRQMQLEKLQRVLLEHAESFEEAIRKDGGHSDAEVALEYVLTLQSLKDYHNLLNEDEALHQEYAIARGQDSPKIYDGIGIVYIVPTSYTLFYSIIVGISAAIAAGNCVVVELATTLRAVPSLLRKLLKSALDPSIIEFVNSRVSDEDLGEKYIRVYQDQALSAPDSPNSIHCFPKSRVVAIVDRQTDLAKAARELVIARFSFNGFSPYAPDVVLVNEFVKTALLVALTEELVKLKVSSGTVQQIHSEATKGSEKLLEKAQKSGELEVITSANKGSIFEIKSRNSEILRSKIKGPNLIVHSVRSLDDSIDVSNLTNGLLATYIFAGLPSAKYLSQFIQSQVSFVNIAPLELLVGPAAPEASLVNRSLRYPIELLSTPRAEYVSSLSHFEDLKEAFVTRDSSTIAKGLKQVSVTLAPKRKRSVGGQVGYFEQGIFIGLGMFGAPTLLCIGTMAYFGVRYVSKLRS